MGAKALHELLGLAVALELDLDHVAGSGDDRARAERLVAHAVPGGKRRGSRRGIDLALDRGGHVRLLGTRRARAKRSNASARHRHQSPRQRPTRTPYPRPASGLMDVRRCVPGVERVNRPGTRPPYMSDPWLDPGVPRRSPRFSQPVPEARGPDAGELNMLGGDLVLKARTRVGLRGTVGTTRGGVREEQALARTRDGDVGQAALLLQLGGVVSVQPATCGRCPPPCRQRTPPGTPDPWRSGRSSW